MTSSYEGFIDVVYDDGVTFTFNERDAIYHVELYFADIEITPSVDELEIYPGEWAIWRLTDEGHKDVIERVPITPLRPLSFGDTERLRRRIKEMRES